MSLLLNILAGYWPLILSLVFFRNHLFSGIIFSWILFLSGLNMTTMSSGMVTNFLLAINTILFILFSYIEYRWKEPKDQAAKIFRFIILLLRLPLNFFYIHDIFYRLQNWRPIDMPRNGELSIGWGFGFVSLYPLCAITALSFFLLLHYLVNLKQPEEKEG